MQTTDSLHMNAALLALLISSVSVVPEASVTPEGVEALDTKAAPGLDLDGLFDVLRPRTACDPVLARRPLTRSGVAGWGELSEGPFGLREPLLRPFAFLRRPPNRPTSVFWWSPRTDCACAEH